MKRRYNKEGGKRRRYNKEGGKRRRQEETLESGTAGS